MRIHEALRALLGVAREAFFRLRFLDKHRILVRVNCVTANAGDIVVLMLTALPIHAQTIFMTTDANLVTLFNGRHIWPLEYNGGRLALLTRSRMAVNVLRACAVAGFAIVIILTEGRASVAFNGVRRFQNLGHGCLIMTLHAGFCPTLGISRFG